MSIDNLLTQPDFYYWYVTPTIVGATLLIWTTIQVRFKANAKNVCITVMTYFFVLLSQWVLIEIFFEGAWPTYFPHMTTLLSCILVAIQTLLNKQDKKRATNSKITPSANSG